MAFGLAPNLLALRAKADGETKVDEKRVVFIRERSERSEFFPGLVTWPFRTPNSSIVEDLCKFVGSRNQLELLVCFANVITRFNIRGTFGLVSCSLAVAGGVTPIVLACAIAHGFNMSLSMSLFFCNICFLREQDTSMKAL